MKIRYFEMEDLTMFFTSPVIVSRVLTLKSVTPDCHQELTLFEFLINFSLIC